MDAYATALKVLRRLRDNTFDAYFAGGCVRDRLRGMPPKDYDINTSALPDDVVRLFPHTVLVGKQFGVVRVLEDGVEVEVATFRSDVSYSDGRHPDRVEFGGHREDVLRRDFTINGLLYDPIADRVIDLVDGRRDLERRLIRCIGDPVQRFREDKLRILRAVRFACQLEFDIDPPTFAAVRSFAGEITQVSWERIRDELMRILVSRQRSRGLRLMDEAGLLQHILPEVCSMKGVEQPPEFHPEGDVYVHTLLALDQLVDPTFEIAMGTLLHDIGKPKTFSNDGVRIRFNRHEYVGEEMAEAICRRFRLSNDSIEKICYLVKSHMKLKDVQGMRESTLKRFLSELFFDDLMTVCRADILAASKDVTSLDFALASREKFASEKTLKPEPILRGRDLLELGLTPGRHFTEILDRVLDLQLEGQLKNREEAIAFARKTWPQHFPKT